MGAQGLHRTAQGFPKPPHHCARPAGKEDTPGCSASSSTRRGARTFHSSASKTCAMASPWGVHLPDQLTVCRPHPCILLGEGSSRVMYCFFCALLSYDCVWRVSVWSGYKSFIGYAVGKYFLPVGGWAFHPLNPVFSGANFSISMLFKVPIF